MCYNVSNRDNNGSSEDESNNYIIRGGGVGGRIRAINQPSESETDETPVNEVQRPEISRRVRPPPSPFNPRRRNNATGHKLVLKKGRRSRHRYENERRLFAGAGIQPDDEDNSDDEWNDFRESNKSHFSALLEGDNKDLLDTFVNNKEILEEGRSDVKTTSPSKFDPEDAFLNIGSSLRSAMKKHLPWGMLEGLENDIRKFFIQNPNKDYIVEELSSFERLLAHAASAYNFLQSHSFNDGGKRKLKIENPRFNFYPHDPSLSDYLKIRSSTVKK